MLECRVIVRLLLCPLVYTSIGPTLNYTFLFGGPLPWISPLGKRVNYSWHSKVLKDEREIKHLEVFQRNMKWIRNTNVLQKISMRKLLNVKFIYNEWKMRDKMSKRRNFKNVFVINSLLSIYHLRWLKKNFRISYNSIDLINLYFIAI